MILLLGTQHETQMGARSWASQAPNLINVATTRAKSAIYVVGNKNMWGGQPYYQTLAQKLPTVATAEKSAIAACG